MLWIHWDFGWRTTFPRAAPHLTLDTAGIGGRPFLARGRTLMGNWLQDSSLVLQNFLVLGCSLRLFLSKSFLFPYTDSTTVQMLSQAPSALSPFSLNESVLVLASPSWIPEPTQAFSVCMMPSWISWEFPERRHNSMEDKEKGKRSVIKRKIHPKERSMGSPNRRTDSCLTSSHLL